MERSEYIEQRKCGFYVVGTRVSLDSIVYSFKTGDSPRTIRQNFSPLALEQVYKAIAFYLARGQEVDSNIRGGEEEIQRAVRLGARAVLSYKPAWRQDMAKRSASVFEPTTT